MSSRKLRVDEVTVETQSGPNGVNPITILHIQFSRKLTALEVSGVKAVLDGEIK